MGEVVAAQQFDGFRNRHRSLGRHQFRPLFGQRRVQADGHVAVALVEQSLEFSADAHRAHRDAPRTPRPTPVGSQNFDGSQHRIEVVQRLALPHKHDVRQLFGFGQRVDLVQDVGHRQIALETLFSRLAEKAVHLATHLTRHAERGAVAVGDEDGFDVMGSPLRFPQLGERFRLLGDDGKKVFYRSIHRPLTIHRLHPSDLAHGLQPLAIRLRDVRHLVDVGDALFVEPLRHLTARKGRHSQFRRHRFQFGQRHSEESFFCVVHRPFDRLFHFSTCKVTNFSPLFIKLRLFFINLRSNSHSQSKQC